MEATRKTLGFRAEEGEGSVEGEGERREVDALGAGVLRQTDELRIQNGAMALTEM